MHYLLVKTSAKSFSYYLLHDGALNRTFFVLADKKILNRYDCDRES